jgi:50S ribosomal protein L16 3-hydroxylase
MTYSIGFRAPSRSELVAHFCDHVLGSLDDDDRYSDPDLSRQANPGEIAPAALDRLHAMIAETLNDREAFARWFGAYVTSPKYPELEWASDETPDEGELRRRLAAGEPLHRNAASRFAFVHQANGEVLLFVDGQCHACTGATARFAEALGGHGQLVVDPALLASSEVVDLITRLIAGGSLAFD